MMKASNVDTKSAYSDNKQKILKALKKKLGPDVEFEAQFLIDTKRYEQHWRGTEDGFGEDGFAGGMKSTVCGGYSDCDADVVIEATFCKGSNKWTYTMKWEWESASFGQDGNEDEEKDKTVDELITAIYNLEFSHWTYDSKDRPI